MNTHIHETKYRSSYTDVIWVLHGFLSFMLILFDSWSYIYVIRSCVLSSLILLELCMLFYISWIMFGLFSQCVGIISFQLCMISLPACWFHSNHVWFLFQLIDIAWTMYGFLYQLITYVTSVFSKLVPYHPSCVWFLSSFLISLEPCLVPIPAHGYYMNYGWFLISIESCVASILNALISYHSSRIWSLLQLVDFTWTMYGSYSISLILVEVCMGFDISWNMYGLYSHYIDIILF